jgi:transcriptional regulator with PAS, ATPase and Fis domain
MLRLGNTQFHAVVMNGGSDCQELESAVESVRLGHAAIPILVHLTDSNVGLAVRLTGCGALVFGPEVTADDVVSEARLAASLYARGRRNAEALSPWRLTLVGDSEAMHRIGTLIGKVAIRKSSVMITGETGTGKEIVARAIHAASNRSQRPMVSVNCSAFPEGLLESELFGHVRGAFTGAVQQRTGLFEKANHGTIFLDEIGEMPVALQAKLLRVLQEQEFQRLGSTESVKVDFRVISATNVNVQKSILEGRFREDLFYRLNVVPIRIPALRERREDIPLLVAHFVEKISAEEGLPVKTITPGAMGRLCRYNWSGNVRELQNVLEMALVTGTDERRILPGDIELAGDEQAPPCIEVAGLFDPIYELDYEKTVAEFERGILQRAMHQAGGNKSRAAELLRLGRTTLSAKLRVLTAVA